MKKILVIIGLFGITLPVMSQKDSTMKNFVDSVCKCLGKLDLNTIKNKTDAQTALSSCFLSDNMSQIMKLADERGVSITDVAAMEKIGQEVGIELMKQNCDPFIQLSLKMAKDGEVLEEVVATSTTSGTLSTVETKDFCKFIVTDSKGKRNTFYWLHHFTNSEKFVDQPTKFIGRKMKISWQETEVYIPAAKGYFKIKEIKGIDFL